MMIIIFVTLFLQSRSASSSISVSCETAVLGKSLLCTCINTKNNDINWIKDSNQTLVTCSPSSGCLGGTPGYTFTVNNTLGHRFFLSVSSYDFSNCGSYTCADAKDGDRNSVTTKINVLPDSTSVDVSLTNTSSGVDIVVTTGCVYPDEVAITWSYDKSNLGSSSIPYHSDSETTTMMDGTCQSGTCGSEVATAAKRKRTLSLKLSTTGDAYYFFVVIKHPQSDYIYKLISNYLLQVCIPCPCDIWWKLCTSAVALEPFCIFLTMVLIIGGLKGETVKSGLSRGDIAVCAIDCAVLLYSLIVGANGVKMNDGWTGCTDSEIDECNTCLGLCSTSIVLSIANIIVMIFFVVLRQDKLKKKSNDGVKDEASDQEMMNQQNKTSL